LNGDDVGEFCTMDKKKGLGKIRVKSFKRIIISVVLLILAGAGIFFGCRLFLTSRSEEVSGGQIATSTPSPSVVVENNNSENLPTASAETTGSSVNQAMKEVRDAMISNRDVNVKVVNCTKIRGLAEEVRALLESYGFVVGAGNDASLKSISSVIIEKNENISGNGIMNLLGIKNTKKELDNNSRFDILVILGDDFSLTSKELKSRLNLERVE